MQKLHTAFQEVCFPGSYSVHLVGYYERAIIVDFAESDTALKESFCRYQLACSSDLNELKIIPKGKLGSILRAFCPFLIAGSGELRGNE